MAGVDLMTVKELMGHKTIAMTQRYAHLSPAHKLNAVERLTRRASVTTTGTGAEPAEEHRQAATQVRDRRKEERAMTGVEPATSSSGMGRSPPSTRHRSVTIQSSCPCLPVPADG